MSTFVTYTNSEHLITKQNRIEKEFLEAFEEKKPSLEEATILVNPYETNPLAALILFKTKDKVEATLTVHGKKNRREDIVKTFAATDSHVLPVIALYEGQTKVSVKLSNGENKEFIITSQELPADICRCRNIMTDIDYFGTDLMFLTPADIGRAEAFDYRGNIRWLCTERTMFDIKRLKNGNIMTGAGRYSRMPYNSTGLWEMTLVGKVVREYRMPGNYHHDHWELENGNIIALTQDFSTNTVEDMLVELDRNTGEALRTWDFKNFLPQNVGGSGSQDAHDWFHNNALWVCEKTQTITLSGRHQDVIVNFNMADSTLNWIIGDPEGWPQEMQKYFFKPVGDTANFDWQYEQHACVICPNGDVMAFDNGQWRAKSKEKYIKNRDNFSRGVRYRIDKEKMEIEQVWQFGKEWGQHFFSPYICNVEYYSDGHYLVHSGGIGSIDGYASDALPAFLDASQEGVDVCAKTVEIKDNVLRFFMETDGQFYRAERLCVYHDQDNLKLGESKLLGQLDITPTFDTIPDVEEVMDVVPLLHKLEIAEEEDKFVLTALFERGSLAMYVFEGPENHAYYINTAASDYLAMCSGAFLEVDDRIVKHSVSKRGMKGKYEIKVIVDDKKYQTGVSVYIK